MAGGGLRPSCRSSILALAGWVLTAHVALAQRVPAATPDAGLAPERAPQEAPSSPPPAPTPPILPAETPPASAPEEPSAAPEPITVVTEPSEPDQAATLEIKYLLERVVVRGNARVRSGMIKSFVPIRPGSAFDVDDPEVEALRYRLLGTGWFDRVDLHLERGKERGWVVLVIVVEERSTLVFRQLAAGVGWSVEGAGGKEGDDRTKRVAEPYLGLGIAETNFLGTGRTIGGDVLVSPDQQGFALSYLDPVVRASRWSLHMRGTFVNGQEYFGGDQGDGDVRVSVACSDDEGQALKDCEISPPAAVVDYWRAGLTLGTARDVGSFTRLSLDWHGDFVRVPPGDMPAAASELRGRSGDPQSRVPIDFSIEPYNSYVSMLSLGFTYDKRDSAILPTRGTLAGFTGDLASSLLGSDYEFVRLQANAQRWVPLPWGHVLRTGFYAGAVFGYAPFFYKFFVSDLTDLQPSRILGLNLDHRPAPNLFGVIQCGRAFDERCGTAIAQMRQEDLAARADVEYVWPLVRGRRRFLKSGEIYGLLGIYGLADADDLRVAVPGYDGISRLPIDLTADVGVRLDTQMGVFQIGLAKLFWLPVR